MPELKFLAVAIAIGSAAIGSGIGLGMIVSKSVEASSRNPEAHGKIFTMMMIGGILAESLAIYAMVLSFMMLAK